MNPIQRPYQQVAIGEPPHWEGGHHFSTPATVPKGGHQGPPRWWRGQKPTPNPWTLTPGASLPPQGLFKAGGTRASTAMEVYGLQDPSAKPTEAGTAPQNVALRPWPMAPLASLSPHGLSKTGETWVHPPLFGSTGPGTRVQPPQPLGPGTLMWCGGMVESLQHESARKGGQPRCLCLGRL